MAKYWPFMSGMKSVITLGAGARRCLSYSVKAVHWAIQQVSAISLAGQFRNLLTANEKVIANLTLLLFY